jgi:hypothetical protein
MNSLETSYERNSSDTIPVYRPKDKDQPALWAAEYIISNLPPWVYQQNEEPKSIQECDAVICKLEHTIEDIELQIHIRDFELETGTGRQQSKYEHDKWVAQALRAKQTHKYLLSAYKYWRIINTQKAVASTPTGGIAYKLCGFLTDMCDVLIKEPANFEDQLEAIKQKIEDYAEFFVQ